MAKAVIIAIFFLVCGAFINSLGLILMKIGLQTRTDQTFKGLLKTPKYILGLGLVAGASFILVGKSK